MTNENVLLGTDLKIKVELIRERYSIDDEIAILRQKDTKADEFDAWYAYCEQCKAQAKENV